MTWLITPRANQPVRDPYFRDTVLLLNGDGANGAQNNTFIDSSGSNFAITRNGNVTQGSFSPYGDRWSAFFDGSGDFLTVPSNTALAFGTGDFTTECWLYRTSTATAAINDYALLGGFGFYITSTQIICFISQSTGYTATATVPLNTWAHIAFSRSGTTLRTYLNGVEVGSFTVSYNFTSPSTFTVGRNAGSGAEQFTGYISNLRILKGTALYTSSFTPPTSPLTAITNTSLLACHANRFVDGSSNNFTITSNGDTRVERFSPFAPSAEYSTSVIGGSAYFDGSGDRLSFSGTSSLTLPGDFTIEYWLYGPVQNAKTMVQGNILTMQTNNSGQLLVYDGADRVIGSYTANQWTHFTIARQGSTVRAFIDGVLGTSWTQTSTTAFDLTTRCDVGGRSDLSGFDWNGYISNLRLVKGTALYTANFTPPTAPLTAVTNTSLLLNAVNGGIIDATAGNVLETVGNAQVSTVQKQYGTGALYFDGSGDYLSSNPDNEAYKLGFGNMTIECWIRTIAYSTQEGETYWPIVHRGAVWNTFFTNTQSYSFFYSPQDGNRLVLRHRNSVAGFTEGTHSFTKRSTVLNLSHNIWYHVAVVRDGNAIRLYLDGTDVTDTSTGNYNWSTFNFSLNSSNNKFEIARFRGGAIDQANGHVFWDANGYIDDLRITKGVARYTSHFKPPSTALQLL